MYLIVIETIDILLFFWNYPENRILSETGSELMDGDYRFFLYSPRRTRYTRDAILYTQTRLGLVRENKKKRNIHRYIRIYVHKSVYITITN